MTIVQGHVRHANRVVSSPPGDKRIEYRDLAGPDEEATLTAERGECSIRFDSSGRFLSLTPFGLETRDAQFAWETLRCVEQPADWITLFVYRLDGPRATDIVEFVRR